jgi:alkylhydroperoxidase/carboxymuconolactone decarboxylase family protein YurZ
MPRDRKKYEEGLRIKRELGTADVQRSAHLDDEFSDFTTEELYGGIYTRPGLSLRDRELVSIVALIAQGATFENLANHFITASKVGISDVELREVILQTQYYAGWFKGANATKYLNRVRKGERPGSKTSAD